MAEYLDGIETNRVTAFKAEAKAEIAGLMRVGKVTTATGVTEFSSIDLIGQDDNAFEGWYVAVLQADNAAPEGEMKAFSAYTSATGTITHTAFSVQLAVGDWVVLLRPEIAAIGRFNTTAASGPVTSTDEIMAYIKQLINIYQLSDPDNEPSVLDESVFSHIMAQDGDVAAFDDNLHSLEALYLKMVAVQGGSETLESLDTELDAMIDMAKEVDTTTISTVSTEEDLHDESDTTPMYIAGVWIDLTNLAAGDMVKFRVYADWDDSSIADQVNSDHAWTFGGVQTPKWRYKPLGMWVTYQVKIAVNQWAGATQREFNTVLDIGKRGS